MVNSEIDQPSLVLCDSLSGYCLGESMHRVFNEDPPKHEEDVYLELTWLYPLSDFCSEQTIKSCLSIIAQNKRSKAVCQSISSISLCNHDDVIQVAGY